MALQEKKRECAMIGEKREFGKVEIAVKFLEGAKTIASSSRLVAE